MDAIKFIHAEHQKVKRVMGKLGRSKTFTAAQRTMFNNLCQDLVRHETMEEKVWYPKLKRLDPELKSTIKHLVSEEKEAAKAIKEFKKMPTDATFEKKFAKFKQDVLHHANEEETKLFPKVKKAVDASEREKIGKQLAAFKKAWLKKMKGKSASKKSPAKKSAAKKSAKRKSAGKRKLKAKKR